jgi:glutathione S-transferase
MTPLRLYSAPMSMFGMKVHVAALEKRLPIEVVMVPFTDDHRYEPKHPEVLRINPKGQVPVLSHDGLEIFDSTQIFEYLEDLAPQPALWPIEIRQRAAARLLEHKSDEVFFPHIVRLMGLQSDLGGEAARTAILGARACYREREALLANRAYLAGDYSFADIAFYMAQVFAERLGAPMTAETPKLLKWRAAMTERAAVWTVIKPFADYLASHGRPVPAFLTEGDA